jgi:uncharacterized protein (TIGR03086 family)
MSDLHSLSRRALDAAAVPVAAVSSSDLSRPTPCADWDLASLIGHMIAHNRGWAASAVGAPAGASVWDSVEYSDAFDTSAFEVSEAFSACTLNRLDVYGYGSISLNTALRMHIVDYVIHGWDVAAALGLPYSVDPALASSAYDIMRSFPDNPRPNKAFGVKVSVASSASTLDQLLGYVGRDPAWRAT